MIPRHYTLLDLTVISLESSNAAESSLFERAEAEYRLRPKWIDFMGLWLAAVVAHYEAAGLPRQQAVLKPLFRAIQDMGLRLLVAESKAQEPRPQPAKPSQEPPAAPIFGESSCPERDWLWFVTPTAVRELIDICRLSSTEANYVKARAFLGLLSTVARDVDDRFEYTQLFRTAAIINGKRTRLELSVKYPTNHSELPQLIRVRDKGSRAGRADRPSRG